MKIMLYLEDDSQIQELFQRGTITRASTHKRLQFTFPNNLLHFQRFQSTKHIQDEFLKEENLASMEKRGLFVKKYIPNFEQAVRVYFKCKECKAGISFKRQNQYYKLLKVQVAHDHQPRDCRKDQKQYFLKYFNAHADADTRDLKKRLTQQLNINERQFYYLRNLAQGVPATSFKFVQKYLKQRNFNITIQPSETEFPTKITVISDKMLLNCEKYGDAIKFVYYDNNVTSTCGKKYGSVIIYGQDTNMRLVMLAAALIQNFTPESVMGIFIDYFKLSGGMPECIATAQDPIICQAIKTLQNLEIYTGLHVFDLQIFRERIKSTLKSLIAPQILQVKLQEQAEPFLSYRSYYKSLKALFKERDPEKGKSAIINLEKRLKTQDLRTQQVLSELLLHYVDTLQFTCMWKIPSGYVGYIQDVKNTVTLAKDISVIQFFKEIFRINKTIEARYQQRFKQHIEQDYRDTRVKVLRESLQRNILLIFLKQFREAREDIQILQIKSDQFNVSHSFEMVNRNNIEQKFYIHNWLCSCGFKDRTGMPCSHLLKGALQVPDMKYQSLFKERWIKGLETRVHTRRMRKGRARKTRRNHNF